MERQWLEQLAAGIEPDEPKLMELSFPGVNMKVPKDTPMVVTTTTVAVNPGAAEVRE